MLPSASFTLLHDAHPGTARRVDRAPGDLIGRLPGAALQIADPRVSEAHAMVSLRAGELVLLALRLQCSETPSARSRAGEEPRRRAGEQGRDRRERHVGQARRADQAGLADLKRRVHPRHPSGVDPSLARTFLLW